MVEPSATSSCHAEETGSHTMSTPVTRLLRGCGRALPCLGFGTWQLKAGGSCEAAVRAALNSGYRRLDTASIYKNEEAIGAALSQWVQDGGDHVMVTSKCSPYEMGFDRAQEACHKSLHRLGVSSLDLYLIHWPALPKKPHRSEEHRRARHQTWRALEKLYKAGHVRAIGVSNFTAEHLQQLLEDGVEEIPMVNQIELHPLCVPEETLRFCAEHDIVVEAYAPLGGGPDSNVGKASGGQINGTRLLLEHEVVRNIAEDCGRSPAQVLLRWALQKGCVVIPRSSNPIRIAENAAIFDFELRPTHMDAIDALRSQDGLAQKFCWNPSTVY